MSTTWYGYLVDISTVECLYGSKNLALLDTLSHNFARELKINEQSYRAEITIGAPSLSQAVEEILLGDIASPSFAWQYGNALHIICRVIGTYLPNDHFQMMHTPSNSTFLGKMRWVDEYMLCQPRYPIPLPLIDDFPLISYITKIEAAVAISTQLLRDDVDYREYTREELAATEQFEHWLYRATHEQRDILTFYE